MMVVVSRAAAERLLASAETTFECLVSIGGPGERCPAGFSVVSKRLRLEFSDISCEVDGAVAPCCGDVEKIIGFAEVVRRSPGQTLVHCEAGISRSAAAALILLAAIAGVDRETEAVAELFRIHPHAHPNRLMVRLADEILGREGRLLAALEEYGDR